MPTPTNRLEASCPKSASPWPRPCAPTPPAAPPPPAREGEPGSWPRMFADIVVLDPNPFELAPDDLQQAKVQATYVAGKKVYER